MFPAHEVSLFTAGPFQPWQGGPSSRPPPDSHPLAGDFGHAATFLAERWRQRGSLLTLDSLSSSVFRASKPRRQRSSWFSRARLHVFSRRRRFSSSSFWFCGEP